MSEPTEAAMRLAKMAVESSRASNWTSNDLAQALDDAGLREAVEAGEKIKAKCEQYWNEQCVGDEEYHAALAFIHTQASALSTLQGTKG